MTSTPRWPDFFLVGAPKAGTTSLARYLGQHPGPAGLTTLEAGGITAEFLHLEYADGDKLYVPIDQLDLLQLPAAPSE